MDDLISRRAAIDALAEHIMEYALIDNPTTASTDIDSYRPIAELSLRNVPSAQPEYTETHSCEERTETHESRREWYMKGYRDAQNAALHESCTDCPLYDHDRHNCPRFNKVIPTAILDAQQPRWIPVTEALPEDDKRVLCQMKDGELVFGFHQGKYWAYGQKPIAWMPLPPSYKGDEDE